jgi:hypothetical protein
MCQTISSGYYASPAMIVCTAVATYDKSQKDWQQHAGSYDHCADCGGWKAKKAYRCRSCSPKILEAAQARWKSDAAVGTKRKRARAVVPKMVACMRCGSRDKRLERHHVDGDTGNNSVLNIRIVCRRCHMVIDGRLDKLKTAGPTPQPPKPCDECGKLAKPLRRGLCHACNERKRRRDKASVT